MTTADPTRSRVFARLTKRSPCWTLNHSRGFNSSGSRLFSSRSKHPVIRASGFKNPPFAIAHAAGRRTAGTNPALCHEGPA